MKHVPLRAKPRARPPLRLERLSKPLLCVPLVLQWVWLAARYRSLTLPSALNPSIETGGLAGESKAACLAQIGDGFRAWVAPWRLVRPGENPRAVRSAAGLAYPLIAKPDIGWCGYAVRRIDNDAALADYAAAFPAKAAFVLQRHVEAPLEAGLFYVRTPGDAAGRLLSATVRHTPAVVGDGGRDVAGLIAADQRLRRHAASYAAALGERLHTVPLRGQRVVLTTIASLRVGARYEDTSAQITPALSARVDAIARSMPEFHVGRFDVRFASMAALGRGEFQIIEVNGAGSEAINFWDPSLSILDAFRGVFAKQRLLFRLGDRMRRAGHKPVGAVALSRAWLRQRRLIAAYPASN
ncbi:MAG: hypothetical protein NVSMB18_28830 [Acetobacteraceae bacterium]